MIHPHLLLTEVNAMSLQAQITYIALDSGFVNKIRGIHLHLGEIEFIHHDLTFKKRQQLYVYHHLLDVGNGISLIS